MPREPKPGEWMQEDEFAAVVRLTPLVSIDLIIRSPEGRVLLGYRKNEPAKGFYFAPGSRVSKNERFEAAFRRISREELGIERKIEDARFLGVYEHLYPTNRMEKPGFGTHYVVLAYELAFSLAIETLPKDQHAEYAWMTVDELLKSPQVHENTKAYFR
jgi:colanic acid biosynthesis protein WcaH